LNRNFWLFLICNFIFTASHVAAAAFYAAAAAVAAVVATLDAAAAVIPAVASFDTVRIILSMKNS
jgi:hypothetical protein